MQTVADSEVLARLQAAEGVFILFGGAQCQVCQALRPRLETLLEQAFPALRGVYVDCAQSPGLCAQYGVFSLPVVQVFIEGMKVAEAARAFSVRELQAQLSRPYTLWQAGAGKE
jgi:thioredoxin-like negative regulator of GroEL